MGDIRLDSQHPVIGVERWRNAGDPAFVGVGLAVDAGPDGQAGLDQSGFAFRDLEAKAERVQLDQLEYRRSGGKILAEMSQSLLHNAGKGGANRRVRQLLAGEIELGAALREGRLPGAGVDLGGLQLLARDGELGFGGVEFGVGGDPLAVEAGQPVNVAGGFVGNGPRLAHLGDLIKVWSVAFALEGEPQRRPGLGEGRCGLLNAELEIPGLDLRQEIPGCDLAAEVDGEALESAGDLRAQGGPFAGGEPAGGGGDALERSEGGAFDLNGAWGGADRTWGRGRGASRERGAAGPSEAAHNAEPTAHAVNAGETKWRAQGEKLPQSCCGEGLMPERIMLTIWL